MLERRELLRLLSLGSAAGILGMLEHEAAPAPPATPATPITAASPEIRSGLKITRVRAVLTAPAGSRLVVVKVETSEPGLYGLGCATFTQRARVVAAAVNEFLDPFTRGRDPNNIEDLWQTAYTSSYWRNGPVLNNALSGLDMALWDIKGKRAGMPVYQLLGGKCRFAVETYTHCQGRDLKALEDNVRARLAEGFRNVRIQESITFNQATQDVFPGCPTLQNGYLHVNEAPGWGVDLDEKVAAKFPVPSKPDNWQPLRRSDGTAVRP